MERPPLPSLLGGPASAGGPALTPALSPALGTGGFGRSVRKLSLSFGLAPPGTVRLPAAVPAPSSGFCFDFARGAGTGETVAATVGEEDDWG